MRSCTYYIAAVSFQFSDKLLKSETFSQVSYYISATRGREMGVTSAIIYAYLKAERLPLYYL